MRIRKTYIFRKSSYKFRRFPRRCEQRGSLFVLWAMLWLTTKLADILRCQAEARRWLSRFLKFVSQISCCTNLQLQKGFWLAAAENTSTVVQQQNNKTWCAREQCETSTVKRSQSTGSMCEHAHAKHPWRNELTQASTHSKIITSYEMPIRNAKCYIQGCGAVVKMTLLRLRSFTFHEHGSSSGALGCHECSVAPAP